MSPSMTTSEFEIPKSDCDLAQGLKPSGSFRFSSGSTDDAGFDCLKTGQVKSNLSSRSKPRLTKVRRKQAAAHQVGKSAKTDSGLNGSRDVGGEVKLDFGADGLGFGANSNDSLFGSGLGLQNGESLFGYSANSSSSNLHSKVSNSSFATNDVGSNSDVQEEAGAPMFGPNKGGLRMDSNLECKHSDFGVDRSESVLKESSGSLRRSKVDEIDKLGSIKFAFGTGKYDTTPNMRLKQPDSNKAGLHFSFEGFGKDSSTSCIFGFTKDASADNNTNKSDSVEDARRTVPDTRGNGRSDTYGDSEKANFEFPFSSSHNCKKNRLNFVFGCNKSDLKLGMGCERNPNGKYGHMFNFGSSGKENAENGTEFPNGDFVFGGSEGMGGPGSGCSMKVANGMDRLNGEKAEGCDVNNNGSGINFKFQSGSTSGGVYEESSAFSLLHKIKKLNIDESGVDANSGENYFPGNSNNVFVFGSNEMNPGKEMPHENHSSPKFLPSLSKDEKDLPNFTSKRAGSELPDADYRTPNLKFTFSSCNFIPGIDNADAKSHVGKRSKKRNGKLRQKPIVQQLFHQNHKSPDCGSPMDFSPYNDSNAGNAPDAERPDSSARVTEEFAAGENNIMEHSEKTHDVASNSNLPPSLPSQDGLSSVRRLYKKKYKLKVGPSRTVQGNDSDKENAKQELRGATPREVCEHWRLRGNEAYHAGKLSKAEEFYTMGIDSVPDVSTLGYSMKPLLLCFSNRAATRMSLGRMTEAIGDCSKAAALDPTFLKVMLRAGNCYLVLGEVEDAIQCYSKCLNSETDLCLDRRVTIEAAEGLQKAKKVAEYMQESTNLLQEGTHEAASSALQNIEEALSISRYSERLYEMKGEALCNMRMHDDAIKLCEQTLEIAKKNYNADCLDDPDCKNSRVKLWRWHLQIKSLYHLGKLDSALELIEKQETLAVTSKSGNSMQDSSVALAATIRELLCLKKSGNEAFNAERYTEAIENYTAAISKSFESRPFMAVCFCNRAAAYQSINQIVDAIADCSIAIALDENYQKAISRRATLYEMIRDYPQAVCDLQSLVSLLTSKSQTKNHQQNDSRSRSSGGGVRDLRKARRRLSLIEDKTKMEIPLDHYLILGIKVSDTESEIKKAYRKAALKHHPDKAGQALARSDLLWKEVGEKVHEDADKLFKIIGAAYAVVSDPSKRSKYDAEEELRNNRDCNRSSNSGRPSTSYSSYERGSWSGRYSGFSTSSERNSSRRYAHDSRTYGNSYSRW